VFGGPLETRHENGNFREFHTVAGGNFLISKREFPVALLYSRQAATFSRNKVERESCSTLLRV